jgi:pimeloyl-ACP methyl ester carboxylesterase
VNGELNPILVFVHGWSSYQNYWRQQVNIFSKDFKIMTIDLAGFGESGNNRKIWDMPSFGQDVSTVVNNLNLEKVILIGHSKGESQ